MTAIRLARGFTGRDLLVKFAGHYHGHSDGAAGRGRLRRRDPRRCPARPASPRRSPRRPRAALQRPRRRAGGLRRARRRTSPRSSPRRPPPTWASSPRRRASTRRWPTHRARARRAADPRRGAHRVPRRPRRLVGARGPGAASRLRARPGHLRQGHRRRDAAGRARRPRRDHGLLAPLGPVYQAGTLSGNPVAVAAGIATLRARRRRGLRAPRRGRRATLSEPSSAALAAEGVAHTHPARRQPVQRRRSAPTAADAQTTRRCRRRRRAATRRSSTRCSTPASTLPPSVFEAWFVSAAHDDAAMARIVEALPAAAGAAAATARPDPSAGPCAGRRGPSLGVPGRPVAWQTGPDAGPVKGRVPKRQTKGVQMGLLSRRRQMLEKHDGGARPTPEAAGHVPPRTMWSDGLGRTATRSCSCCWRWCWPSS